MAQEKGGIMKDIVRALGLITKGLLVDGRAEEPGAEKARAYLGRRDYAHAAEELKKAISSHSGDPEAHYDLGVALVRAGKLDDAMGSFVAAIKRDPRFAEAHYNLGVVFAKKGMIDDAIR